MNLPVDFNQRENIMRQQFTESIIYKLICNNDYDSRYPREKQQYNKEYFINNYKRREIKMRYILQISFYLYGYGTSVSTYLR